MEDVCARLKREIVALKKENGRLEKLYVTNSITKLTSKEEMSDWYDVCFKKSNILQFHVEI
jgi:hypothetical protein